MNTISLRLVCSILYLHLVSIAGFCGVSIFPEKNKFQVKFKVAVKQIDGNVKYDYEVENEIGSQQSIDYIHVEHEDPSLDLNNTIVPANWSSDKQITFEPDFKDVLIQNGFSPNYRSFISWSADPLPGMTMEEYDRFPPKSAIDPGEKLTFSFTNQRSPLKIVNAFMQGWTPTPTLDEENNRIIIGDQIIENADDYADSIFADTLPKQHEKENSVRIKTLGPTAPITDQLVICDTFILDLIAQVREGVAAGWIKHDLRKDRDDDDDHGKGKGDGKKKGHDKDDDEGGDGDDEMDDADKNLPGVAKSIIQKLTKVRRECMRGKFGSAREKLRVLIKQVNAQRGKHLTEEAYALIKFNVEFLLEKI